MSVKEKMMDGMFKHMSGEERQQMMNDMMDKFLGTMSSEERQKMMEQMMAKFFTGMGEQEKQEMMRNMMAGMMGGAGPAGPGKTGGRKILFPWMDMMGMMAGCKPESREGGANPMEMCQKMFASIGRSSEIATFATPEIRGLFEDWVQQMEEEILGFIQQTGSVDSGALSDKFKLSKESITYFLTRLAQKQKINFKK